MKRLSLLALLALLLNACNPFEKSAQAIFEEKCQTVAGEKIYKTVEGVDGVLLIKVRPKAGEKEWADPMWPGAAFAQEFRAEEYIKSFMWFEHPGSDKPITTTHRGFLNDRPSNLPGYRYLEVIDEKDGTHYRYTGRWEEPWKKDKSYLKGYVKFYLDRTLATDPNPRYGVTFEDHVLPEERKRWIASSTVKVIDLQTNEILGEMTRYAWSRGGPSSANPSPWLSAYQCPRELGRFAQTRQFVDQILIPVGRK